MKIKRALLLIVFAVIMAGCGYRARPIDINKIDQELTANNLQLFLKSLEEIPSEFDLSNGISEKEAVFIALSQNPGIVESRKSLGISEAHIMIAEQIENPTLGVELNHSTLRNTNTYEWELSQLVTGIIESSYKKDRAEVGAEKIKQELYLKEWALVNKTKVQYLDILYSREILSNVNEELRLATKLKKMAQKRLDAGDILQVEFNSIEIDHEKAHQKVLTAKMEVELATKKFSALLGFPPNYVLTIKPDVSFFDVYERKFNVQKYTHYALTKRIEFKILLFEYKLAEKDLEIHYLNRFPLLEVGPRYENAEGKDDSYGISLGIKIPIWNQNKGNIKKGKVKREQVEQKLKNSILQGRVMVHEIVAKANLARTILKNYKDKVLTLTEKNLELSNRSYQLGKIDLFQEYKAQSQYIDSKKEFLDMIYKYKYYIIKLEEVSGGSIHDIEKGK